MPDALAQAALGLVGAVVVAYLTYRGVAYQAKASREANRDTATVSEQQTVLKTLESMTLNLLQPHIDEAARMRKRVEEMERAQEGEREERERKAAAVQEQLRKQSERIDVLTVELGHWKRLARVIARWATTLRDQVISLGGTIPATPNELLLIQSIDDEDL